MIIWQNSESREKPIEVEVAKSGVYVRENITTETRTNIDNTTYTMYVYQEAIMTESEYNLYILSKNTTTNLEFKHDSEVIDNYTLKLIEEGTL